MDVFLISPASSRSYWYLVVLITLLAVIFTVLAYTAYSSRHSRVEIVSDGIRLVGNFWGREIPFDLLNVADASIQDITKSNDYSPRQRTLGTGLPGYSSGWYRLRNGERALVYLTKRENVVYLPTTDGYSLLLSVEEPKKFIATLQKNKN